LANPIRYLHAGHRFSNRAYLTPEELARLGDALADAASIDPFAIAAIRLLILTGARLREILHAKWREVDFEHGIIFLLLGLALAVAGMTFSVSNASANPTIGIGCSCGLFLRNGSFATFTASAREKILIRYAESGDVNAHCQVDLGSGSRVTFDASSTGFPCFVDGVATTDWQREVIAASGQTTLVCHIKH
jgi:hypothetical protein